VRDDVSIVHPNVLVRCGLTLLLPAELRDADAPIGAAGQLAGGDDTGGCRSPRVLYDKGPERWACWAYGALVMKTSDKV